tara:strand:+ start:1431 stop:2039 length:609 start_codon:yes stop_codon:yes gene_type:complete
MEDIKAEIKIYNPINTNKNVYYSKIMFKNSEICLQINKNSLVLNKDKNKAKLVIDGVNSNFIKEISKAVVEITSEKSEEFFGKQINIEDCQGIYKEALVDNTLHCFYDKDTYFYDKKKSQLNLTDLPSEIDGIALLKCSAVVYTKHSFFIRWEISQFKVKNLKESEEIFKFDEYMIKDTPDHEIPIEEDSSFIEKLEEICLF